MRREKTKSERSSTIPIINRLLTIQHSFRSNANWNMSFLLILRCVWSIGYCTYRITAREISVCFGGILPHSISQSANAFRKAAIAVAITSDRVFTGKITTLLPSRIMKTNSFLCIVPVQNNRSHVQNHKNLWPFLDSISNSFSTFSFVIFVSYRLSSNCSSFAWWAKRRLKRWSVTCCYRGTASLGRI